MKLSPRIGQFMLPTSDAELDAHIAVPVSPVTLRGDDATGDAKLIGSALREMFLPDRQARAILRFLAASAKAHAVHHLDTDQKYVHGLYSKSPWGMNRPPAICFTGPAGAGKSNILRAFGRLVSHSRSFSVEGHSNIPLVATWLMTVEKGDGLNQLLSEHIEPLGAAPLSRKARRTGELLQDAARISWRGATCVIPVDEFQWIAASSAANTRAATVLLKLHGIGPILVFCANFSMIHKLKRRPAEDRDRLLSCPIVLKSLASTDPDWVAYLEAVRGVAPDVLTFVPQLHGKRIHQYTFGIKRKVVDLVVTAVQMARSKSKAATVGPDELLAAYRSARYGMHRKDVEALLRQEITGRVEIEDLWCPFAEAAAEAINVTAIPAAVESFERRVEERILSDAMLPSEAAAHRELGDEASPSKKLGKVLRFRSGKVTKESLLEGAAALDASE